MNEDEEKQYIGLNFLKNFTNIQEDYKSSPLTSVIELEEELAEN